MNTEQTVALLIDADNAQEKKMENVILEISTFGRIVVKRAYGNWTKDTLKKWEEDFRKLAIKPIQQIDYVKGKNATDMALTIDAMDFLYNSTYDIYAIVSSDSDFTPLAIKLREAGKKVIGIGKKTTSEAFIQSCDNFMFIEEIGLPIEENNTSQPVEKSLENKYEELNELDKFLQIAANTYQDEDGFTNVSSAGSYIKRVKPGFNIHSYGVKKIPEYLEKNSNRYEITRYKGKGVVNIIAYRIKNT
ncbi:MAG TPA: hypothetical protein DDW78_05550 [Treponema sp.]|nr:hypothetical protein [Treponema sp.]